MNNIKNLRLRWNRLNPNETNFQVTFADYTNMILLAHHRNLYNAQAKIKDIAEQYKQTVDSITELVENARRDKKLPMSPFGLTEEGLKDYRGFPLEQALFRLEIENTDFSYSLCKWAASIYECNLTNSKFVGMDFSGRILSRVFENCNFNNLSLINGGFNTPKSGLSFINCTFVNTDFSYSSSKEVNFARCSFENAKMKWTIFSNCTFTECNFKKTKFNNTSFKGSKFISTKPSDKQLRKTITK